MKRPKEIDDMSFKELMKYLGIAPLPKGTFKPRFMRLSPSRTVRNARVHASPKARLRTGRAAHPPLMAGTHSVVKLRR